MTLAAIAYKQGVGVSVKRFDHSEVGAMYFGESEDGSYVEYSTYAALKEENERLEARVAELAAIAYKQGSGCMTIKRYELLDLSSADGPSAMVTESEEGTYVLHADHAAEVAALKARIAELEEELAASEK